MSKKIEQIVQDISKPIAEQMGFELVDCEYKKVDQNYTLTVFIDKQGGVSLDDCEKLSRMIEENLDEVDPISNEYILSISSPGLDREVKNDRDFERNIGKKIWIKVYKAIDKKKEFIGNLVAFNDQEITILSNNENMTIERKDIAIIKQYVAFN